MRHGEPELTTCTPDLPLSGRTNGPLIAQTRGAALPIVSQRPDHKQGCCSASDAEDARRVADALEIPFYALNLSADFARIIDYFVDEYSAARTPNPCVLCNNWLKFGKLFEYADSVGAEFVATGHYARIRNSEFGMRNAETEPRPSERRRAAARVRSHERPILRPLRRRAGVLAADAVPVGRLSQAGNSRAGSGIEFARGRQAR